MYIDGLGWVHAPAETTGGARGSGASNAARFVLHLTTGGQTATQVRFQDLQPEAQRLLNSIAAAARRDGEAAGRQAAEAATRTAAEAEEARRRETEGAADQRATAAIERANTAERERDEARRELLQLRVAMRVGSELGVTNPDRYADRLRGSTEAELEADARSFFPSIGNVIPRPETPPATPAGGNEPPAGGASASATPQTPITPRTREEATEAQRGSGNYNLI
jgi:hypothetical protein